LPPAIPIEVDPKIVRCGSHVRDTPEVCATGNGIDLDALDLEIRMIAENHRNRSFDLDRRIPWTEGDERIRRSGPGERFHRSPKCLRGRRSAQVFEQWHQESLGKLIMLCNIIPCKWSASSRGRNG